MDKNALECGVQITGYLSVWVCLLFDSLALYMILLYLATPFFTPKVFLPEILTYL